MSTIRSRPRFRKVVPLTSDDLIQRIKTGIQDPGNDYSGTIVDNHIILTVPKAEQHYWSPQLSIEVEPHEDGSLLRGLFGPKPAVWTMFMFFYSGVGFFTVMGLMWALSQWMIGQTPDGLWAVLGGISLLLIVYLIASIGKGMGQKQMQELDEFFLKLLE